MPAKQTQEPPPVIATNSTISALPPERPQRASSMTRFICSMALSNVRQHGAPTASHWEGTRHSRHRRRQHLPTRMPSRRSCNSTGRANRANVPVHRHSAQHHRCRRRNRWRPTRLLCRANFSRVYNSRLSTTSSALCRRTTSPPEPHLDRRCHKALPMAPARLTALCSRMWVVIVPRPMLWGGRGHQCLLHLSSSSSSSSSIQLQPHTVHTAMHPRRALLRLTHSRAAEQTTAANGSRRMGRRDSHGDLMPALMS